MASRKTFRTLSRYQYLINRFLYDRGYHADYFGDSRRGPVKRKEIHKMLHKYFGYPLPLNKKEELNNLQKFSVEKPENEKFPKKERPQKNKGINKLAYENSKISSRERKKLNRDEFINSREFLESVEWRAIRYDALKRNNGCCELCGASKNDGVVLNVDHIKPRKHHPELALDINNLQVLCAACNHGKGNRDDTDWRNIA